MARRTRVTGVAVGVPRGTPLPISTGSVHLTDDPDGSTTVWVNGVPSSTMRSDPAVLDFEYMRHFAAAIAAWKPPPRMLALHVGAGVCTMARHLVHAYPHSRHIAVDVDATLPELAREWWDLPRSPQLRVRQQDGFDAVASRHPQSLDLLLRDAFAGDSTPATLANAEWWAHAAQAMRPDGLVVANVSARPGGQSHRLDAAAAREAFPTVVAVGEPAVLKGRRRGNVVLVAAHAIDVDALRRYSASAPLPTGVNPGWTG